MNCTRLIPLTLLVATICRSQTTLTLQASRDAAIGFHDGANTASNNYGSAIQNAAFWIPSVAQSGGVNGNRALIDFSLAVIPPGATVVSAYINLYALSPYGTLPGHTGTTNASYLQRITQNWGEFTVTWLNQPSSTTLNQVTLPQSSSASQNYTMVNVTQLVQDMISNPSAGYGFLLKLVNESVTNAMPFGSKDHTDPSKRPTLVVTYVKNTVGISESQFQDDLIYPNPVASGFVMIRHEGPCQFTLQSSTGQCVYESYLEGSDPGVDLRDVSPGLYLYRVTEPGRSASSGRLIISGSR
jgi:hypothetical protein